MSFMASLFGASGASNPDDDRFIMQRYGPMTPSGKRVNEHLAMNTSVVYACVRIIADTIASVPIDVMRRVGDRRIPQPGHPVAEVLGDRMNPHMSAMWGRQTTQAKSCLWGNGHLEIQRRRNGKIAALWPLPEGTRQEAVRDNSGRVTGRRFRSTIDGVPVGFPPERVFHVPALGFDGYNGYSQIWMARNSVGLTVALEEFGSRYFSNDSKSGGVVSHPGELNATGIKNIRDSFEDQGGNENAHRIKVLDEGMKFIPTSIPPEDAQFLGTRSFQVEDIARFYGVPLHLLQNHAKDTSWGSGISEQVLGFVKFTLHPWYIRWEQEANWKLLTEEERRAGFYVRHNLDALLRGDAKARADYYTKGLNTQTGWLNRNEVRSLEDLNPEEKETPRVQVLPGGPPEAPEQDPDSGG